MAGSTEKGRKHGTGWGQEEASQSTSSTSKVRRTYRRQNSMAPFASGGNPSPTMRFDHGIDGRVNGKGEEAWHGVGSGGSITEHIEHQQSQTHLPSPKLDGTFCQRWQPVTHYEVRSRYRWQGQRKRGGSMARGGVRRKHHRAHRAPAKSDAPTVAKTRWHLLPAVAT